MSTSFAPSLRDRIHASLPAGRHGLHALLRIADVVETEEVPTAAVTCASQPLLLVNPVFVEKHAPTTSTLLMLVLHELHHVLLGHTRLCRRLTPLDNIVFDAVINAMLAGMFPEEEHLVFFTSFYDDAAFPACFLRPAPGWRPGGPPCVPRALQGEIRGSADAARHLAELHARLYSSDGISYDELRDALSAVVADDEAEAVKLLGDHAPEEQGASSAGGLESRSPVLFETVRHIVERWPRPPAPITGRSPHELLELGRFLPPRPTRSQQLAALMRSVAPPRGRGERRGIEETPVSVLTPLPRLTRRSVVQRALGFAPLLFDADVPVRRWARSGDRVHVYLDVSGSIGALARPLAAAVLACGDIVHPVVHQFSTKIHDVTLAELRAGVVGTTGGTCIECVGLHAAEHDIRRAVIVTDGFVGRPSAQVAAVLRRMRLGVALLPQGSTRADLEPYANEWVTLGTEALS